MTKKYSRPVDEDQKDKTVQARVSDARCKYKVRCSLLLARCSRCCRPPPHHHTTPHAHLPLLPP